MSPDVQPSPFIGGVVMLLSPRLSVVALLAVAACTTKEARRADTAAPATATLAGTPAADPTAVRRTIEAIYPKFGAALIKGDTAAVASIYTDDAILMPNDEKAAHGHDEIAKAFAGMVAAMKPASFTGHTQDVIVSGDYAIETGKYEMTLQPKKGQTVNAVGKYLTIWKKQADGSYKISHDIFNSDSPSK
jgi:uncharacterized protein (TIGR02246 family)